MRDEFDAMEKERKREREMKKEKESSPRRGGDFHKSVQIMWERFVAYHRLLFQYVQKLTIVCDVGFFSTFIFAAASTATKSNRLKLGYDDDKRNCIHEIIIY